MIDRNRVRELAEKPLPATDAPTRQAPTAREALLEYLEEVEPDVEMIERVEAGLMGTTGRSGRLATADGIGRHRGLQKLAGEYRALQERAIGALEQARIHDQMERARRRTRGRKSRPGLASEEQRALSDRLARVLVTLERFVSRFARIGEAGFEGGETVGRRPGEKAAGN